MVQSAMLVALGFLLATLISLLLAPVVWKRAARLATDRLKASLPISLTDFHAEKDQLRADHAIQVRGLEMLLEQAKERTAKQMVELGRQRSEIMTLTGQIRELRSALSERKSLIAVMEQTLNANVPRLRERLEVEHVGNLRLTEQVEALEGTLKKQTSQLEVAGRDIKLREGEIQKLRQEISTHVRSSPTFRLSKNRTEGGLEAFLKKQGIDLANLDIRPDGQGAVVLSALQEENGQLREMVSRMREQLTRAKAFEEEEVPLLREELRELGGKLINGFQQRFG